jgi:hypothetical protein
MIAQFILYPPETPSSQIQECQNLEFTSGKNAQKPFIESTKRFHLVRHADAMVNGKARYVPTLSIGFFGKNITFCAPQESIKPIF